MPRDYPAKGVSIEEKEWDQGQNSKEPQKRTEPIFIHIEYHQKCMT